MRLKLFRRLDIPYFTLINHCVHDAVIMDYHQSMLAGQGRGEIILDAVQYHSVVFLKPFCVFDQ